MFCPNCGTQIPDGSGFCPNCGAQLGGTPQQPRTQQPQEAQQSPKAKSKLVPILAAAAVIVVLAIVILPRIGGGQEETVPIPQSPYDATKPPDIGDFTWEVAYFREGVPEGARIIKDFSEITGTWKGQIYSNWIDYEHEEFDLMTVGIGGAPSLSVFVADWYMNYRVYGGRSKDTTGDADTMYTGSFENGTLTVTAGKKTIILDKFYELDGKQYGCGTIEGESHTAVSLVRP